MVMMPLWIALCFLATCGATALLLWPSLRAATGRKVRGWAQGLVAGPRRGGAPAAHAAARGRWAVAGVAALLLTAPALLAWRLGRRHTQPGFDDQPVARSESEVVMALLHGEQLVPPPPLPPAVFLTPEVQTERPQLASADRRWEQLHPDFRQRLLWVYKAMKEQHGYDMVLIEGYRSPERQDMLSRQGPHVTLARAWESYHQYGLAADSAFLRNGRLVISERDPWAREGYALYGQLAVQVGLVWGGVWQNADLTHVELRLKKKEPPGPP